MKISQSSAILEATTRTGAAKFWQGHVCTDGSRWFTSTSYWQVNKKGVQSVVQHSEPYEATPKNVGRSNETTAKEQAILEFNSMIKKQMDKGYSVPGVKTKKLYLPMLAQKFKDRGRRLQWPAWVQPKYNGMRMLYDGKKGWSRGGKLIIPEVIQHLQFDTQGFVVDGELILPNNQLLQETMKAAKKYRPGVSDQLMYYVYDVVVPKLEFGVRYSLLKGIFKDWSIPPKVILSPTFVAHDVSEVMGWHERFTEEGYEGTMIRDNSEGYTIGQRSNQLQKFKDFVDSEFKIVDVVEGEGSFKGCAIFVCETTEGTQFNCTPEGSMDYRAELYKDRKKHIGNWLTIRYQELSNDNVPIFPVGVDIREEKDFV